MQQTKHTRRACTGGAAARPGEVTRPVGVSPEQNGSGGISSGAAVALTHDSAQTATRANGSADASAGTTGAIPGLPPGGFATILVDPPWPLQGGEKHYRTMSLARIMALPVGSLAARDAHLWLWTTNALLPTAYEVAAAWGFTVRSPLTWVKFRLGLGGRYQLRNATEQLLFCTRGKAPLGSRSQPTWFNAPVQEHSRKPAEQFAIIERVSPGPYLELFARRMPESNQPWAVWGDEVASDIRIPGFAVPRYSERVEEAEAERTAKTAVASASSVAVAEVARASRLGTASAAVTGEAGDGCRAVVRHGITNDGSDDASGNDGANGGNANDKKETVR